jgi:glycosyltransferase involved in cell wall biosynthesis
MMTNSPEVYDRDPRSIFDAGFYAEQQGRSFETPDAAFEHYRDEGWKAGFHPHPLFDVAYYLKMSPDVAEAGIEPLEHFMLYGAKERRSVSPRFDSTDYLHRLLAQASQPQAPENLLLHYLDLGQRQGLEPMPVHSTEDVVEEKGLAASEGPSKTVIDTARVLFDEAYYRRSNPRLNLGAQPPFEHFMERGAAEHRNPVAWFSTRAYLLQHPELTAPGVEPPFFHYLRAGMLKPGERLHGDDWAAMNDMTRLDPSRQRKLIAPLFDSTFYLQSYPDIRDSKWDPLEHYLTHGGQERRDPAPWFSSNGYLEQYPELVDLKVNPLVHFALVGERGEHEPNDGSTRIRQIAETTISADPALRAMLEFRPVVPAGPFRDIDRSCLDIHWVIPDFTKGSGGHMTIFRMVRWLEFLGHRCTIWVTNPQPEWHEHGWLDDVIRFFQPVKARVQSFDQDFGLARGDVIFATSWDTVFPVMSQPHFAEKFYFVQDLEPLFYARGAMAIAAEETYRQDISCICASDWLRDRLTSDYGRWARSFELAYDRSAYFPSTEDAPSRAGTQGGRKRIAFYSRDFTERRAVSLGMLALEELSRRRDDFEVHLFGNPSPVQQAPFAGRDHGVIHAAELGTLYRSCVLGVSFSTTNYSLVPQEMMACGLPVLEIDGESTQAIYPGGVVARAAPDPILMADALERLLDDASYRNSVADRGRAWVRDRSWERSGRMVEAALLERLDERAAEGRVRFRQSPDSAQLEAPSLAPRRPRATVAIPTYNGGAIFRRVLEAVKAQRAPWEFEIAVIDSSSTDGTWEHLEKSGIDRLRRIPGSEFQHGRTRNSLVEMSQGDFVAFITQDALPTNDFWLYNLVSALEARPGAAGAFGHHYAWPEADPFTRRDMQNHFKGFLDRPLEVSLHTDFKKWQSGDRSWRQFLHFYSDNNSCLRRTAWEEITLPEVNYGEDQLWALQVIRAGYSKVYAKHASVYHSHDYDYDETFERARVEGAFFEQAFDYQLVKSRAALEQGLAGLNRGDLLWARGEGLNEDVVRRRLLQNRAKFEGWISGHEAVQRGEGGIW